MMSNQKQRVGHGFGGNVGTQFDVSVWRRYNKDGTIITNDRIEQIIATLTSLRERIPSFTSHSKEQIDAWINSEMNETNASTINADYVAVISIQSGFFIDHKIILKNVRFISNEIEIDYSCTDPEGKLLENMDAIGTITSSIVSYILYEQVLNDEYLNA